MIDSQVLLRKYLEEKDLVQSNIESFNSFVDWRLQRIIDENNEIMPAVVPPDVEEIKIVFGAVRIGIPVIIEADGAERPLLPMEARIRELTYGAPIYLEVGLIIDGKERERVEVQVATLPIMVGSNLCHLSGLTSEELIKLGEDPLDSGGYFIINGTERILVLLEDLAPNTIFVKREKVGPSTLSARIFSASQSFRIPHQLERLKEGLFVLSFSGISRIPFVIIMKALGVTKDKDILEMVGTEMNEEIYINLFDFITIKTQTDAQEFIAKTMHLALPKDRKLQRVTYVLDNLLLPHLGRTDKARMNKAYFVGRMVKKLLLLKDGKIKVDDKDHYMNKRVRLSGDLLEDLFRTNVKVLINDALYIFQRGVRRGKLLPINTIIRTKLLTQRIKSAMATGKWTANRQGVSQRLERDNIIATLSHLRRVVSLLESNRESFQARELHPTHWGRLCPLESPEGKNIGLRKNLALMASITPEITDKEVNHTLRTLETLGVKKFPGLK